MIDPTVSVHLRRSRDCPKSGFRFWVAIEADVELDPARRREPDLESAFDACAETWWTVARMMAQEPSAEFAHAPTAAPNESDFGLMLAWTHLVDTWSSEADVTLVVCDDPWLFRHLSLRPGVRSGKAPGLALPWLRGRARGIAARAYASWRMAAAAVRLRSRRGGRATGGAVLLVYGHPASTSNGMDAYFGSLMREIPSLARILHVDCPPRRALSLMADSRTTSLHGWGSPLTAVTLIFTTWRPSRRLRHGPRGWLIRRAAHKEGSGAGAAAIRWQSHCQERWLNSVRPRVVAWPWENHAWERTFVRGARRAGVRTIGYQHSVVGRQGLNYAAASLPDGYGALPDRVVTNGQATRDQLESWGIPAERLAIGGALRSPTAQATRFDPAAAVFLALPFDGRVCEQMISAARADHRRTGRRYIAKAHPMTPFRFKNDGGVKPTELPLGNQPAVAAVVYALTTVGLEALLMGLPTFRFRPRGLFAIDIQPRGIDMPVIDAETFSQVLDTARPREYCDRSYVFAPVDLGLWRSVLDDC